jgi:hypothetical protein
MFTRGFFMFIFLSYSVLANADGCPPGPFECVPWTGPVGPKPAPPPPPFFRIEIKNGNNLSDIYKHIKEHSNDMELYVNTKSKSSVLEQTQKYKHLIDDNSLYYMQIDSNKGVIFKGSELKK